MDNTFADLIPKKSEISENSFKDLIPEETGIQVENTFADLIPDNKKVKEENSFADLIPETSIDKFNIAKQKYEQAKQKHEVALASMEELKTNPPTTMSALGLGELEKKINYWTSPVPKEEIQAEWKNQPISANDSTLEAAGKGVATYFKAGVPLHSALGIARGTVEFPAEALKAQLTGDVNKQAEIVKGIANFIARPTGLKDWAKALVEEGKLWPDKFTEMGEAWETDPFGSAMAVLPFVKGGFKTAIDTAKGVKKGYTGTPPPPPPSVPNFQMEKVAPKEHVAGKVPLEDLPESLKTKLQTEGTLLIEEAKKYKTAEEFVKAQSDDTLQFKKIKDNTFGLDSLETKKLSDSPRSVPKDTATFRIEGDTASISGIYASQKGTNLYGKVIRQLKDRRINKIQVILQSGDSKGALNNLVKKGELKPIDGSKTLFEITDKIKTKSQLTDIWNKANKTSNSFADLIPETSEKYAGVERRESSARESFLKLTPEEQTVSDSLPKGFTIQKVPTGLQNPYGTEKLFRTTSLELVMPDGTTAGGSLGSLADIAKEFNKKVFKDKPATTPQEIAKKLNKPNEIPTLESMGITNPVQQKKAIVQDVMRNPGNKVESVNFLKSLNDKVINTELQKLGEHKLSQEPAKILSESQQNIYTSTQGGFIKPKENVKPTLPDHPIKQMFEKTKLEKEKIFGTNFNKIRNAFVRKFVDVSGNIKRELAKTYLGQKVVMEKDLMAGSSAKASYEFNIADNKIYDKLSKAGHEVLDKVITARRIKAIGSYKPDVKHPTGIKYADANNYLLNIEKYEGLSKPQIRDITRRADEYFSSMREQLGQLKKNGIITEKTHNHLLNFDYSPREFLQYLDPEHTYGMGSKKISITDSGLGTLKEGSEGLLETNSNYLLAQVINRTQARIFRNNANRALYKLAEEIPDNGIVKKAQVIGETKEGAPIYQEAPAGYEKVSVIENGIPKEMMMPKEMAMEWVKSDPQIARGLAETLQIVSGQKILKAMATGYNPAFVLSNIPRDIGLIWMSKEGAAAGYSSLAPKFIGQISLDIAKVLPDVIRRKGRVIDYIKEGGSMEFLTHYGRFTRKGNLVGAKLTSISEMLGWIGETSEVLTRMSLRERAIKNGIPSKEATSLARKYLDFSQGGSYTKAVDNVIPYLNAGVQGTRSILRGAKSNKARFAWQFAQLGTISGLLYLTNYLTNPEVWKSISDRDKEANFIITTPLSYKTIQGEKKYIYFKIPKDQGQRVISSLFETLMARYYEGKYPSKQMTEAIKDFIPITPAQILNQPVIGAYFGYALNKDFWTKQDIWKGREPIEPKEEYTNQTHPFFVEAGGATGLSPERMKYSLSKLFTYNNPFVGLVGGGWKLLMGKTSNESKYKTTLQMLAENPSVRRLMSSTNQYEQQRESIEQLKIEANTKSYILNRDMDNFTDIFLKDKTQENFNKIIGFLKQQKPEDKKRLENRFESHVKLFDIPERRWWIELENMSPETRAVAFWVKFKSSNENEKKQLLEIGTKIGILNSERFQKKILELKSER